MRNYCFLTLSVALFLASQLTVSTIVVAGALDSNPDGRPNTGPRIEISPDVPYFSVSSQNPSDKTLTCRTAGDKPEMFSQIRWAGPNRRDNWEELKNKHSVSEERTNSWVLEFVKPTNDDSGEYYCLGRYHTSDSMEKAIKVKVFNPIKLEHCPDRQHLVQGSESSRIVCRITADEPRVRLWKDNVTIDRLDNRYIWDNDDALVINGQVKKSDAGRYLIKVTSESTGENRRQEIDVEVHSKPEILPFNGIDNENKLYAVEGDPAFLECKVSGNPQPLVYWLDPKRRNLTTVGGYIVNQERGTLQINKVTKTDDQGMFECVATNTVGTVSQRISMEVDTRPSIVSFENKTVEEFKDVEFECRSTGEPQPIFSIRKHGNNQVAYYEGDSYVKDASTVREGGGSNIWVHRLRLTANRTLFGLHYCNATNRAGTAERIGQLTVSYKPDLSQTPPEQFVKLGKPIAITCHIRAYPAPIVTWKADNTQIINVQSSIKTSSDGQTHIVTMSPPINQQTAASRFICHALNSAGISEQTITPRFTSIPGSVSSTLLDFTPTTVKLLLNVPNDGGDRIKKFKYKAEGRSLDMHNPLYSYRVDRQNETYIDASLNPSVYIIRNLLPYYSYIIRIRAVNDVGEGDETEIHVDTPKPTRPEPPVIIKPGGALPLHSTSGIPSDYSNGYVLKWSPPELDNGEPVTKYIIKYNRLDGGSLDIISDIGQQRVVEQMNERPMYARLGPLEAKRQYRIQLQAQNKLGDSEPAVIVIHVSQDRPPMPEFEAQTLAWLTEPSISTVFAMLALAIFFLVVIDLFFCFCFQIGIGYKIRSCCCPAKTNSVMSDKQYT